MSAIDKLKEINFPSDLDCAVIFYGDDDSEESQTDAENAANELLDLRAELTDAKERAKTAEENWHKNKAWIGKLESELRFIHGITMGYGDHDKVMLAKDADIFMQCFKALGLDVSGTDPEEIVDAIKRLTGDL